MPRKEMTATRRQEILDAVTGREFIKFYKGFMFYKDMRPVDAYVLSFLLDYFCNKLRNFPKLDWFFCTCERMEAEINIKRKTQYNSIKKLAKLGLIEIKTNGMPPKRYIRFNMFEIEELWNNHNRLRRERQQQLAVENDTEIEDIVVYD